MENAVGTPFQLIYDSFYDSITDDMYVEWTKEDTEKDIYNILLKAIPKFEFPRFRINKRNSEGFEDVLSLEEIEIISGLMVIEWYGRQINTIDNTRLKYSSSDFKFTSQANHLNKLVGAKNDAVASNRHLQRLYKRRKTDDDGYVKPNFSGFSGGRL